ncbi:MAG: hypothetical protein HKN13_07885 [Rhodothermales bacterium]|nr:hypothetical protein [Rhodothermales bacterium]
MSRAVSLETPIARRSSTHDLLSMKQQLVTILVACTLSVACEKTPDRSTALQANLAASTTALDQLSWLQGYWTGDHDGTQMEEVWLPPRGNVMVGMHVDLFASGRSFFEYLRIEQRGDTLMFLASPRGRPATTFTATAGNDSSISFENLEHDFPQRISYRIDDSGSLHAGISGEVDGETKSQDWIWHRTDFPGL